MLYARKVQHLFFYAFKTFVKYEILNNYVDRCYEANCVIRHDVVIYHVTFSILNGLKMKHTEMNWNWNYVYNVCMFKYMYYVFWRTAQKIYLKLSC